jgi:hypothetical protein
VTDDKGQTATATTPVTIEAPYVAATAEAVGSLLDHLRQGQEASARVDNEAKACLDDIALTLQSKSDASTRHCRFSTAEEKAPPKHMKKARSGLKIRSTARSQHQGLPGNREGH